MPKLLFIDTNIYLDFYRIRNEVKPTFIAHLEAIKEKLVMTDQVEMEFKKNRQNAILEGLNELKPPSGTSVPGLLRLDKSAKALDKNIEKGKKSIKKLKDRMVKVLENPTRSDKVYQALQRLFAKRQDIDLYRKSPKRYDIRNLAQKRFLLGYPPRKKNDTSIGDSINWEWIVHVAKEKNADIWIVSRDGDYGVTRENKGYINDWLRQEFKDRVHKKRNVTLCYLLSHALKEFKIPVTKEEELQEEKIASEPSIFETKASLPKWKILFTCPNCKGRAQLRFDLGGAGERWLVCQDCGLSYQI